MTPGARVEAAIELLDGIIAAAREGGAAMGGAKGLFGKSVCAISLKLRHGWPFAYSRARTMSLRRAISSGASAAEVAPGCSTHSEATALA